MSGTSGVEVTFIISWSIIAIFLSYFVFAALLGFWNACKEDDSWIDKALNQKAVKQSKDNSSSDSTENVSRLVRQAEVLWKALEISTFPSLALGDWVTDIIFLMQVLEEKQDLLFAMSLTFISLNLILGAMYTYVEANSLYSIKRSDPLQREEDDLKRRPEPTEDIGLCDVCCDSEIMQPTILALFNLQIGIHVKNALEKGHTIHQMTRLRLIEVCIESAPQMLIQIYFWFVSDNTTFNGWLLLSFLFTMFSLASMIETFDMYGFENEDKPTLLSFDYWLIKFIRIFELAFRVLLYGYIGVMFGGAFLFGYALVGLILSLCGYILLFYINKGTKGEAGIMDFCFLAMMNYFFLQPTWEYHDCFTNVIKVIECIVFASIAFTCSECVYSWLLGAFFGIFIISVIVCWIKIDYFNVTQYNNAKICDVDALCDADQLSIVYDLILKGMISELNGNQLEKLEEFNKNFVNELLHKEHLSLDRVARLILAPDNLDMIMNCGIWPQLTDTMILNSRFSFMSEEGDLLEGRLLVENLPTDYSDLKSGSDYSQDFLKSIWFLVNVCCYELTAVMKSVEYPTTLEYSQERKDSSPIVARENVLKNWFVERKQEDFFKQCIHDARGALFHATMIRSLELVKLLIAGGADVEAKDGNNETSLILAARAGERHMIAKLLLEVGADVEAKDGNNETSLILAARAGDRKMVELLLSCNANPQATDRNGESAVDIAEKHNIRIDKRKEADATITYYVQPLLVRMKADHRADRERGPPLDPQQKELLLEQIFANDSSESRTSDGIFPR